MDGTSDMAGVSKKKDCFESVAAQQEIWRKLEDTESILNFTNFSSQLSFMYEKFSSDSPKRHPRCICPKKPKILSEHASPSSCTISLKEKSPGGSLGPHKFVGPQNFSSKGSSDSDNNTPGTSSCSLLTQ
jgi:hypothetical protein